MRFRKGCLPFVALLGAGLVLPPAAANSVETTPVIEAIYPRWSPEQEAIKPTKTIDFVNANGIPHGVRWTGGPASIPKCTGVPINSSSSSWSGSCTFEEEGTYTFECTVHPVMKGTIYVNATGTIPPPPPTATTESASAVMETSATLKGTVNPNGEATEYVFEYGTSTGYGHKTEPKSLVAGTVGQAVSEAVTGLTQGTIYHFRVVAKNPSGTTHGADETFTTTSPPPPPGAPTATTAAATSMTEAGATLKGTVNPDGETTKYVFNYGTSTSYGQHSAESTLAATDHTSHPVSAALTGLTPGTTYHFQLAAENKTGVSDGADMTFTTTSPPPPPKEEPPPSGGTTTTPPPPVIASSLPKPEESLAAMAPPLVAGSLKLAAPGHGSSVRGSIQVSPTGAGGRLEVDLLANGASLRLRGHRSKPVVVGRFVRSSVPDGKVSFSVSLNARGKSALRRRHRLAVTVRIALTPPAGAAVTVAKTLVLRG